MDLNANIMGDSRVTRVLFIYILFKYFEANNFIYLCSFLMTTGGPGVQYLEVPQLFFRYSQK